MFLKKHQKLGKNQLFDKTSHFLTNLHKSSQIFTKSTNLDKTSQNLTNLDKTSQNFFCLHFFTNLNKP